MTLAPKPYLESKNDNARACRCPTQWTRPELPRACFTKLRYFCAQFTSLNSHLDALSTSATYRTSGSPRADYMAATPACHRRPFLFQGDITVEEGRNKSETTPLPIFVANFVHLMSFPKVLFYLFWGLPHCSEAFRSSFRRSFCWKGSFDEMKIDENCLAHVESSWLKSLLVLWRILRLE